MLLTEDEIESLTGARQTAAQERVLEAHRIFYVKRRDGKVATTWHWVNRAPGGVVEPAEPDYNALNG